MGWGVQRSVGIEKGYRYRGFSVPMALPFFSFTPHAQSPAGRLSSAAREMAEAQAIPI